MSRALLITYRRHSPLACFSPKIFRLSPISGPSCAVLAVSAILSSFLSLSFSLVLSCSEAPVFPSLFLSRSLLLRLLSFLQVLPAEHSSVFTTPSHFQQLSAAFILCRNRLTVSSVSLSVLLLGCCVEKKACPPTTSSARERERGRCW